MNYPDFAGEFARAANRAGYVGFSETKSMSTLAIAIGEPPLSGERITNWEIWETNAPKDYDGFGTFTVLEMPSEQHRASCDIHLGNNSPCTCDAQPIRTVLIRCEHWNWQTARYASGNNWHRPSSFAVEDVARYLWDRVLKRNGQ